MAENQQQIERLQAQLDKLVRTQIDFQREVSFIHTELKRLRASQPPSAAEPKPEPRGAPVSETAQKYDVPASATTELSPSPHARPIFEDAGKASSGFSAKIDSIADSARSDFEKFIGENLLSKVGIVILVLGVAIGAKYAIDKGWISPAVRIIFGYVSGFALVGIAVRLRAKYETFSAVLISGGMAVMYFITYFAYSLYQLIGQTTAFTLMVIITVVTVAAAIKYSRQIIAHLGLVGAYATPFLLSDDSGRYAFLFTYIAIVNAGILVVCLNRYWKLLFYTSFAVTWLTFYAWYIDKFVDAEHFPLAMIFAGVYFLIFYVTFIGYKFRSGQNVAFENVGLILANSGLFYAFGYRLLAGHPGFEGYLGLFTIANAAVHLVFAFAANKVKTASIDFVYLLGSLVLTFITISIPVQFDGQFVTLVWTLEAAMLFVIGRSKSIELYEYYSYPLMFLASASLFNDFAEHWRSSETVLSYAADYPFFNGFFITSISYVAAFALIYIVNRVKRYECPWNEELRTLIKCGVAAAGTAVLYNAFRVQIGDYFDFLGFKTAVGLQHTAYGVTTDAIDWDLAKFSVLWQINYSMLFLSLMAVINITWFRSVLLAAANLALNLVALFVFITAGLYTLSELRGSYLDQTQSEIFGRGIFNIGVRYVSYAFVTGVFVITYQYLRREFLAEYLAWKSRRELFEMLLSVSMLIILSSELLNVMDLVGYKDSYKLGLSIFWGVYSLILASIGIYRGRKYLRISAIVLFGVTLAKLFLYDLESLDTLSKTAVFVSLGILMLIVSFLYHKYKSAISSSDESELDE